MLVLNVILIVTVLICLAYILRLKYLKLYTRERFAWFIVMAAMTLVSPYLFRGGLQGKPLEDKLISFLLIAMVIWFMYALFINWDRKQQKDEDK
ncbi:hypothetical protein A3860_38000 [Niastella vici]|uniref:Uncharacterized protein n=1 Tax=Niastella vici TaxID=1703345 RepID=A0A1V9FLN2_9BACT|nr:hypothetical protein [Niastella vici]OQP59250.1 hypothetical protein A3860_38000 [Niastella vici]